MKLAKQSGPSYLVSMGAYKQADDDDALCAGMGPRKELFVSLASALGCWQLIAGISSLRSDATVATAAVRLGYAGAKGYQVGSKTIDWLARQSDQFHTLSLATASVVQKE